MRLIIPHSVLDDARRFFEDAGSRGCEGTGMLAGTQDGEQQLVNRFVAPDQRASNGAGCWVEVTDSGKLELVTSLHPGERWLARIHSHPGEAFHSATDDDNSVLTSDGSWSIVVPFFGLGLRRGIEACAIHHREHGRWRRLHKTELSSWITPTA